MFKEKHRSKFLFLEGVWLSDCIESEPIVIKPKPKVKKTVKNPCVNCGGNPASDEYYIISSIAKNGDGYVYSKMGNATFCGFNCAESHITINFKMMERFSLIENIKFYQNHQL
jgi:hypothetical protein